MIDLNKLKNVDTPARYTGGEARQFIKNSTNVSKRVCVAVPAMYEMGLFDFDLKDMYYVLNQKKDIWCERAFAPMPDFEKLLKAENEMLYTLESKTPLKDMDVIIFVLSSELMYTNMLNMLNLGGIPVLKDRRQEGFPLIIATGSAVLNPKPLEAFVDLFVIGEPSLVVTDIINKTDKSKTKDAVLQSIKDISGVYIPRITAKDVHMIKEQNIDNKIIPKTMVVPSIATMMDKSVVNMSSGCDKNCITCTHKYVYGTPQHMSVDKAVINAKRIINATGNTSIMLMTNCHATYPGFPEIIYRLNDLKKPEVKDISFMEVKLNKDNLWLLKYMEDKKEIPSVIVGAPTETLRRKLGIGLDDEQVEYVSRKCFEAGFNKIRLKYIIGVPGETYEDFAKILSMANRVCKIYKEVYSKSPDKYIVEINLYNFKAKPHTPSVWCAVNTAENLELKARYIKDKNKNELVVITSEDGKQTVIETLLARGDEIVGKTLYEAWKQGARHDMIQGIFSMDSWQVALSKTGVDIKRYLEELNEKKLLPWDNIIVGTSKEELRRIYVTKIKGD